MTELLSTSIPQQLYRPEQVREHEAEAATSAGLTMWELMQTAGRAAFTRLQQCYDLSQQVAVLCGPGNNGGDGYVVAALAREAGYSVRLFAQREPASNDARQAAQWWVETGGEIEPLVEWAEAGADVIVDALLGTGLNNTVRDPLAEVIASVNESGLPVLAIDIPSGLHGDTGQPLGVAIKARHTVTFVGLKRGLVTGQAADYTGVIRYADLGILREFRLRTKPAAWYLQAGQLPLWLPPRPAASHKGDFGHVLVVGGSRGMAGAVRLAGTAALRTGAGKVTVVCEPGQEALCSQQPELMVQGLQADERALHTLLQQATVVAVGPGLGQGPWGRAMWALLKEQDVPLVVDADGLNFLARERLSRDDWVLTPHPGEAGRLLDCSGSSVQADRWQAAARVQETYGGTVVLKGYGSIVQGGDNLAVNSTGHSGMASAGMGDVLTGMIAAILAQRTSLGLTVYEATAAAVLAHGQAAEAASNDGGPRGLLASDVIRFIPHQVNYG